MNLKNKYEDEFIKLEMRNGILFGTYKKGPVTLDMAKEIVEKRLELTNNKDVPTLALEDGLKGINRDARQYLSSEEGLRGVSAGAMVTKSALSSHLANLFIRIHFIRPKVPMKMFTTEKDAINWLNQFK